MRHKLLTTSSRSKPVTRFLLISTLSLFAAGISQAETLPLRVQVFCGGSSNPCGYASEEDLRQEILIKIGEVNLEFIPSSVSFRPEIHVFYDTVWNAIDGQGHELLPDLWAIADAADSITLFLIPGLSPCWSRFPLKGERGVFCDPSAPGTTYAHELGHFLCQRHTFTDTDPLGDFPDPATHDIVVHDGDAVADTPDDPGIREGWDTIDLLKNFNKGLIIKDVDADGNPIARHQWCRAKSHTAARLPDVDLDSPHSTYCVPTCFESDSQNNVLPLALTPPPLTSNAMSYYGQSCRGPYVLAGQRTEAFTEDQLDLIEFCRNSALAYVPDACPGTGDQDQDGWCDAEDTCPGIFSPLNRDSDDDTIGDLCDSDTDGDGCSNRVDDDPLNPYQVVGRMIGFNCDLDAAPVSAWSGEDSDGDNLLNCQDLDDDNDGIPDIDDPCPTIKWPGGPRNSGWESVHQADCLKIIDCPLRSWQDSCLLGGCIELLARIEWVINPDPTQVLLFDQVAIQGQELFLGLEPNTTVGEQLRAIAPQAYDLHVGAQTAADPIRAGRGLLALDLISKSTGAQIARVAEFDPAQVAISQPELGSVIRIRPSSRSGDSLEISGSWGPVATADRDRDSLPDLHDNCISVPNPSQHDRDGDGRGNACDLDLDNDGDTDLADIARVERCAGTDLTVLRDRRRGDELEGTSHAERIESSRTLIAIQSCSGADLNNDGRVDGGDLRRARALLDL